MSNDEILSLIRFMMHRMLDTRIEALALRTAIQRHGILDAQSVEDVKMEISRNPAFIEYRNVVENLGSVDEDVLTQLERFDGPIQ